MRWFNLIVHRPSALPILPKVVCEFFFFEPKSLRLCSHRCSSVCSAHWAVICSEATVNHILSGMVKGFHHVEERERHLIRNMQKEGIPWTKMEKITQRSRETLNKILHPPKGVKKDVPKGQPKKLGPKEFEKVLKAMDKLQKKNHPKGNEVTADMILTEAGVNVSERTLSRELRRNKYYFYKLKERQTLTSDDVKEPKIGPKTTRAAAKRLGSGGHTRSSTTSIGSCSPPEPVARMRQGG